MLDVTQGLIISQFRNLEQLGYRAMAFGFFEDDAQAASTSDCTMVLQPKFVKQSSQGLLQVLLICPLIFVLNQMLTVLCL